MSFWDTEPQKPVFDFESEKRKLIENMDYLMTMSVQEQTLYKKWVELQEPNMIQAKSQIASYYDLQWKPTDINNKELTIKEIEELEPYVEIVEDKDEATKWTLLRKMIHTMSWTANPGRNVKLFLKDKKSGKLLGLVSLASDVTSMGVRDKYIGWKKENFIGKDALVKQKTTKNRKKVTFEWNAEDVVKVIASAFKPGEDHFKWIDFPQPNYASSSADMVMQGDKMVGMSMFNGYSYNERCFLSLGVVAADVNIGDVLTLKWGEPEPTGKTSTEPHQQTEIRVRVSATPYAKDARENYADSWRTKAD